MVEPRITIAGYYGFGNAGDEAILTATVNAFHHLRPNWHLTVLSANPALTAEIHQVEAIPRFNLARVARELLKTDLFLFGGGSLLQDTTSLRSLLYYLTMLNLPLLANRQVMVYANGFGPVRSPLGRWGCRHTLNRVPVITLRDGDSQQELLTLGVTRPRLQVTADPAFLLTPKDGEETKALLQKEGLAPEQDWLMVAVRDWPGLDTERLSAALDGFARDSGLSVLFVPMHGEADRAYSHRVAQAMKQDACILQGEYQPEELLGVMGSAQLVLGMRMHAIIFAAVAGVPAAGISYDPKVTSLLKELKLPILGQVDELHPERMVDQMSTLLRRRAEVSQRLRITVEKKRQQALDNIQRALALVEN